MGTGPITEGMSEVIEIGRRRKADPSAPPPRVVIIAHGHPDYSAGGAEMAAYSLYRAMRDLNPDGSHLLTWISPQRGGAEASGEITRLKADRNEWLFNTPGAEYLFQSSHSRKHVYGTLIPFLKSLRPDVIHFHHFLGLGVDAIRAVRLEMPDVRIVFTLHEFLAICLRDGQMITTNEQRLCSEAGPVRCNGCFPDLSRSHFALREAWFRRHFDLVDGFLAPSGFVRERYVAWGIPADRVAVVENAQICTTLPRPSAIEPDAALRATFGFFGQLNPYKGADVLIAAALALAERVQAAELSVRPRILIYGTMAAQDEAFQARTREAFAAAGDLIDYRGGYDRHEVLNLMSGCGWVLAPSIWWENSPVVIEEAFYAGRPVICSNIGGMKEKVAHGVNGLHFRARDPYDLARVMFDAMQDETLWRTLSANVRTLPSLEASARAHYDQYARLAPRLRATVS